MIIGAILFGLFIYVVVLMAAAAPAIWWSRNSKD